ncbi:MAG: hypothetical protein HZB13_00435 [Acidobacteria bacterium]|nr:hypothetical protein [Acidobacteriota bacterium]
MAVYRRGYQRYQGPLTGRFARLMAMPAFAWERLLQQRLVVIMLCVSMLWPLLCMAFIYLANLLARMMVLVGLLSMVTWVPGVILFTMQSSMAGWGWFTTNWRLGAGVVSGFLLWIVLVSLVAMASSAYVKWRIIAGALVLGFFFILAGVAEMVNGVLRVDWGSLLNPSKSMYHIWCWMLGAELPEGPGTWEQASAVAALAVLLIMVLERKLRPVEVIK